MTKKIEEMHLPASNFGNFQFLTKIDGRDARNAKKVRKIRIFCAFLAYSPLKCVKCVYIHAFYAFLPLLVLLSTIPASKLASQGQYKEKRGSFMHKCEHLCMKTRKRARKYNF